MSKSKQTKPERSYKSVSFFDKITHNGLYLVTRLPSGDVRRRPY